MSAWPVRAKVAAVAVLPLALAMGFGVLRIQTELSDAAELSAAADNSSIVVPILALDRAVGDLALTGARDPGTDYAPILDGVRTVLGSRRSETTSKALADFERAVDGAEALDARLQNGPVSPLERGAVTNRLTQAISALLVDGLSVESAVPRALTTTVVDAMSGRRSAQIQQLLVSVPDVDLADSVNRVAGRESSDLAAVGVAVGADSSEMRTLQALFDGRLESYASAATGGPTNAFLSAEQSTALYGVIADRYAQDLVRTLSSEALDRRSIALRDTALVLGSVLMALVLALVVARSLVQPIRRLRLGALGVAHRALPSEIEQIRSGGHTPEIEPIPVHTGEEIGQLARAVDAIHEEALQLAGEQARLRVQVGNMFETLSLRSRSLVDQQLALIEELERDEDCPRRLDSLFRLDHLATRMRRNGANLMVLADTASRRALGDQPVALDVVMSAAVSEVEDYRRVLMLDVPDAALSAGAAADVVHLVAELIDNALRYSPPDSAVAVTAARAVEGGILLEVADRGLGMPPADIEETNDRLTAGGEVTPETARRMGLFVVGRLSQRHGVTVRLRATQVQGGATGVTVSVHIPVSLVVTSFPTAEHLRPNRRQGAVAVDKVASPLATSLASTESAAERTAPVSLFERTALSSGRNGQPAPTTPVSNLLPPPPQSMPINQRMVSEWLVDPATGHGRSPSWSSPADAGWAAAETATEAPVANKTESGLPVRKPGARLVPGAVDSAAALSSCSDDVPASASQRSPESVRATLTTHFKGVRRGRAEDVNGRHRTAADE
ncbi:ATP-binding protein [Rhodococcus sp. G-MC3]|uniref:ATP-binding protein n=1 Tax=Rhodococcus sp. G-MC3 TaxID=3046209 RepID=UPI0024BB1AD5|nr:ATP-binding protein [Rhodococcus sp. G-MC3]MDJ0392984.1 ATP-binding protein [Rhodococcus sp. G-MC3]